MNYDESHLDKYVEAQAVDVVDVTQSKQAGEQAAGQHAHCQVQPNGQALPDDAAALNTTSSSSAASLSSLKRCTCIIKINYHYISGIKCS